MDMMRPSLGAAAALGLLFGAACCTAPARAEENGLTQWPIGVQTIVPAILPPPGATEYYNYNQYVRSGNFNDSSQVSSVPNFSLTAVAEAGRVVHTWETSISGFNLSSGAIVAGNYVGLQAAGTRGSTTGLNFAYLTPLYLTYTTGDFHFLFGPSVFVPLNSYHSTNFVNSTNGYVSYAQEFAVTYTPTQRLEISFENLLSFNATNPADGYHSGAYDNTDFDINYAFFEKIPNFQLGLNGFYVKQFQNDTLNGVTVGNGNKLEKFALGPQAIYYFDQATAVAFKWQHELVSRNGPKAEHFWIEFAVPLGSPPASPTKPVISAKY